MNELLRYYIDHNSIPEYREKYSSAKQELIVYKFKGTNGRYLSSYINKFEQFSKVENLPYEKWGVSENTGQSSYKQYTVPMRE